MRQVPVLLLLGSLAALDALAQSGSSLQFLTVAPCRIMDTRNPNGPLGGPYVAGGTTRTVPIPSSTCGIPANASAYSLNFTVVPRAGTLGYLSVWPTGETQPLVSTLNSADGSVIANAAIVPAGTAGAISAYATNDTDLIVDVNGYFEPPASNTLQFYTLPPCRVLDTRNANGTFGGPSIAGGAARSFPIPSSSCGVPASAVAYAFNVTVVPQGSLGYLTAWPTGQTQPVVSTLNSFDGTVLANAAIVPAGTGGAASFYASNTTDLVVDINGYFASPGSGGLNFYPVTPCRLVDTRNPNGALGGPTLGPATTRTFPLSQGSCGLPGVPGAQAYSLNMTVVPQGVLAYLSTWPTGEAQPVVSTLNAFKSQVVANAAIVPAGGAGSINVYVTNTTDVVIDTNGYFGNASVSPQNPVLSILTAGTGSGTVGSSPPGASCGSGCLSFAVGTAVTLTAAPSAGSTFAGWSGACSGTGSCSVTMNSSRAVTATFNQSIFNVNPTLTITTSGTGAGTVGSSPPGTSCGSGCLSFNPGTAITLTATPASGSTFSGWSGACAFAGSCNLTMNSSQAVSAAFNMTGFVSGIAASGSPIAGATVTLKDSAGQSSTTTTTANGSYALSTAGMTPPFLVQVQTANGNLYSVSADALTTTIINTHPFTDLMIRSWYKAQGQNIDSAFSNPVSTPAPGPAIVQLLVNAITNLAQLWLANAGVNTAQFNLISSPFAANGAGLDQVLDESTVNTNTGTVTIAAGGTTQTSTITYNTSASTITIASTTTNSKSSSVISSTTVVPTQTTQQTALDGILSTLTGFFNAVASNGSQLTADELTPFMATDLVNDGLNRTQLAASLATFWRGGNARAVQFQTVKSLDLAHGIADVVINLDGSEFWFENVDGNWLIGGDNRIAAINLTAQSDTYLGAQSGSGPQVNVQVLAPQGTVTGVTVTGALSITGFNSTKVMQGATGVQTYQPTPTTQLTVDLSSFDLLTGFLGNNLVPPGTPFTFAVTPASGPVVTYTVPINVYTTDLVTITSPTSGELSSYTLGEPLVVQWTLPSTFPIIITGVGAVTYTGPENSPSSLVCGVNGVSYSLGPGSPYTTLVNATSGTVTIPTTCAGMPVLSVVVNVLARGVNGELAYSSLSIQ